jgi:hypothetical protein
MEEWKSPEKLVTAYWTAQFHNLEDRLFDIYILANGNIYHPILRNT